MKRAAIIALALVLPVLSLEASVADSLRIQPPKRHIVADQLFGVRVFEPSCPDYFPQAVEQLGFFGAVFSTVDRMTRSTRIGSALSRPAKDGKVHEGPKAYRRRPKKKE